MGGERAVVMFGAAILLAQATAVAPVAGQAEAELVQPGVVSTERNETFPAVDPVDGSLWFSVYERDFDRQVMMRAPRGASGWSDPGEAWPSGSWGDRAPRFSPDGGRLFFSSNRPLPGSDAAGDYHLWVVERTDGAWGVPRPLPEPVNAAQGADRHASVTRSGTLYWTSTRPGGAGRSDVYRAERSTSGWSSAVRLPAPINDASSQPDVLVAPDGTWMILVVTDRPGGVGGDDLYLSRREGQGWSEPTLLQGNVNTAEYEYGPTLSPDGATLYFTSHRRGSGDVYRISVAALGLADPPR